MLSPWHFDAVGPRGSTSQPSRLPTSREGGAHSICRAAIGRGSPAASATGRDSDVSSRQTLAPLRFPALADRLPTMTKRDCHGTGNPEISPHSCRIAEFRVWCPVCDLQIVHLRVIRGVSRPRMKVFTQEQSDCGSKSLAPDSLPAGASRTLRISIADTSKRDHDRAYRRQDYQRIPAVFLPKTLPPTQFEKVRQ